MAGGQAGVGVAGFPSAAVMVRMVADMGHRWSGEEEEHGRAGPALDHVQAVGEWCRRNLVAERLTHFAELIVRDHRPAIDGDLVYCDLCSERWVCPQIRWAGMWLRVAARVFPAASLTGGMRAGVRLGAATVLGSRDTGLGVLPAAREGNDVAEQGTPAGPGPTRRSTRAARGERRRWGRARGEAACRS